MAIAFNCPHCQFAYNLPDKLAGKQARCKNPECRKVITVPAPVTVPDDLRKGPGTAALERLALDALADEPPKVEEVPVQEKVIPMTCTYCDHKWTEPWSKAGKNALCPNPECRQRQKVPEPKEDKPTDWKQPKTKLPTLAKQNFEKLDGVVSANEVRNVSGVSLEKAGATDDLYEPRSIKPLVWLGIGVVALIAVVVFGIWSLVTSRVETRKDALLADARTELDAKSADMSPAGAGLSSALLHAAAAEYALSDALVDSKGSERLKDAQAEFDKARNDVRKQPPGPERYAVAAELALATLAFAGTDEQVKEQLRYPWQPDVTPGRAMRLNERTHTIHQELTTTLNLLQPADFEFRAAVARRLTRELVKQGQVGMATDLLPVAMFSDAESAEARAVIALEVLRLDRGSAAAKQVATELKAGAGTGGLKGNPYPYSAQALFIAQQLDKPVPVPGGSGAIPDPRPVLVNTPLLLLDDKVPEAVALALRAQQPDTQLKAVALCAEWAKEPGPALDAAVAVVGRGGKQSAISPSLVLRLSQLASLAGKHDQARTLADALADDGLKSWARGDAVRWRLAGNPKERPDETWVEVPDDPKKVRAGHAWGRMWVARHNTKESRNRDGEKKATASWPGPVHPFALAGIALGLQDK
ncbi:unnamed protein product [Gemmataceae bacterium]|nr:unnamed protein product [Gemmataceae bacterium]VTU01904.1 unnamed protein product [Gemmataceae bacterium]